MKRFFLLIVLSTLLVLGHPGKVLGASALGGSCGGIAGTLCGSGLVCNYTVNAGRADASGVCVSGSKTSCNTLWWFDSTTKTCAGTKSFCGAYMYAGLRTFTTQALCKAALVAPTVTPQPCGSDGSCPSGYVCKGVTPAGGCAVGQSCTSAPACYPVVLTVTPTVGPSCNNLWWFDRSNPVCAQKQFCGAYTYLGLQTFSTQDLCKTAEAKFDASVSLTTVSCKTDAECAGNGNRFCYQRPMPVCPVGKTCVQSMPAKVCASVGVTPTTTTIYCDANGKCPNGGTCLYPGACAPGTVCNDKPFCSSVVPTTGTTCHDLWWFDNTNKSCSATKQFCGAYMYAGLRTFSTQAECVKSSVSPTVAPTCAPRPACFDGIDNGSGVKVYCDPQAGVVYCPKPTGIAGDANGDGVVDLVDFSIWKRDYLQFANQAPEGNMQGDLNKDGKTDLADFSIWKVAYMKLTPTCIPRPACLDANPACMMKLAEGAYFCPKATPTSEYGCHGVQVECIKAPCPTIMVCVDPAVTMTPTPQGDRICTADSQCNTDEYCGYPIGAVVPTGQSPARACFKKVTPTPFGPPVKEGDFCGGPKGYDCDTSLGLKCDRGTGPITTATVGVCRKVSVPAMVYCDSEGKCPNGGTCLYPGACAPGTVCNDKPFCSTVTTSP